MSKQYKKFLYEDERGITFEANAKNGITLEASEGTNGELFIKARKIETNDVYLSLPAILAGEYAEVLSVYTDKDGNKAVVPPGWTVSGVDKENTIWGKDVGLVIYQIPKEKLGNIKWSNLKELGILQKTYDQFVWVPVKLLDADGTLDGKTFNEKFGRRNYQNVDFSELGFCEKLTGKLLLQFESVKRYGGYYFSRYDISKNERTVMPQSVKGQYPWPEINIEKARKASAAIEVTKTVTSHMSFGAEYDSIEAWLIKSGTRTREEIAENSTECGNYCNTTNAPNKIAKTGSRKKWCANNIYDFTGNVVKLTQERFENYFTVVRGGYYNNNGYDFSAARRSCYYPNSSSSHAGFRITLYIK